MRGRLAGHGGLPGGGGSFALAQASAFFPPFTSELASTISLAQVSSPLAYVSLLGLGENTPDSDGLKQGARSSLADLDPIF